MTAKLFSPATDEAVRECSEIIKSGGNVVFPTETVYGLGANALDPKAVDGIFKAKGRPSDNPLIVHLAYPEDAEKYAYTNEKYYALAKAFMPGPLTVILKKREIIPDNVTCGLDTVGLRVPSNPIAHRLIELSGVPIAAPSANKSGRPSPTEYAHVVEDMGSDAGAILDGGESEIGVESTVIRLTDGGVEILRPGRISPEDLENAGFKVTVNKGVTHPVANDEKVASPGMKYRHYAPKAKVVILDGERTKVIERMKAEYKNGCGILCFEEDAEEFGKTNVQTFGRERDAVSQAKRLFDSLRAFDGSDVKIIYSRMPDSNGVGLAVTNRLLRAAGFAVEKI